MHRINRECLGEFLFSDISKIKCISENICQKYLAICDNKCLHSIIKESNNNKSAIEFYFQIADTPEKGNFVFQNALYF